jgi:LysM repeat protein
MSRARRKRRARFAHYAAPAAFLLGVTIAVLLVRSGLDSGSPSTTAGPVTSRPATTATTTRRQRTTKTQARFYTVQQGDTFGSIAAKEGMSVELLQQLNPGVSSNSLQVGQRLRVK